MSPGSEKQPLVFGNGAILRARAGLTKWTTWDSLPGMSTKELAHAAIDALPDDATLQDAAEKLALLAALDKSRESVKTGHWKTQADVEALLPQWCAH